MKHSKLAPDGCPPGRCLGTSTALALTVIAKSIITPGWHEVIDHTNSTVGNRYLLSRVRDLVEQMGLKHFTYNNGGRYPRVRCDIMEEDDA